MMGKLRITISLLLISGLALVLNLNALAQSKSSEQGDIQQIKLKDAVKTLEKTFNVSITINGALGKTMVNISDETLKQQGNIETALTLLIKDTDLSYVKMRDDFYVIGKKDGNGNSMIQLEGNQDKKVLKGVVNIKSEGSSIPGATILVKGTNKGVITDIDGHFSIEVSPKAKTIVVSYLGMKTQELEITDIEEYNIDLEEDAFGLDEVVVSGVASATPRKNLTISVSKVNEDVLKEAHSSSAASTLQGKVAGVTVVQAGGLPGSGAAIRLRGSTSLNGANAPLVIMDGIIMSTGLSDINIDDIESMEVVKGAAASALYGSRAGNGVIVITTKRGSRNKEGITTVSIREELGSQAIPKYIEQATHHPYQLAEDNNEYDYTRYEGVLYDPDGNVIAGNRKLTESGYATQEYAKLYEHQKDFFKKGFYNSTYVSVMGNSAKTNFSLSYEFNKQKGVLVSTDGYQRNNFRINLDHKITKKLKLSTSNLVVLTKANNPGSYRSFSDLLFVSPDVDLYAPNEDGTPYKIIPDPWSVAENPIYPLVNRHKENSRRSLLGSFSATYDVLDWLSLVGKYTYEYRNKYWSTFTPKGYLGFGGSSYDGTIYKRNYNNLDQNMQFTANLNKQFGDFTGKVKLSYLYENRHWDDMTVLGKGLLFSGVPHLNNATPDNSTMSSYSGDEIAINYFGILDMDYKDKYLFSALLRYDASSLFGENYRWNPYYRFSLGYRITQEVDIPGIQELKIRASQGTSGQRPGYSWQYETWNIIDGGAEPSTIGNKNLRPSETSETELGLDMNFLRHFSFTFTYSQSSTKDAFALAPAPAHLGYPGQYQNVGTLSSQVFEASIGANIVSQSGFQWSSNLNFDRIRQQIDQLSIPEYTAGPRNAFYIKEGETFGIMYGYTWVRDLDVMANQLPQGTTINDFEINNEGYVIAAGSQGTLDEKPIKLDADNDGLGDKIQIGDGNPSFTLNWGNTFKYKGFNFYMLWSWKNGGDIYNYTRQWSFRDQRDLVFDQTDVADTDRKTIKYYDTFYDGTGINSYFIEDGSYLKLRELSLYYSLAKDNLPAFLKNYIKSFRIGVQARNLLTITNYKGYDPEVASGSDLTNYPVDDYGYPNYRTFTGSISINF